jgi:hypothetical protein
MRYAIKKDGRYLCHKGHYAKKPFLSDDIEDAKLFKSVAGCKTSKFGIVKKNSEYTAWKERFTKESSVLSGELTVEEKVLFWKKVGKCPKFYSTELKEGYEIVPVRVGETTHV